MAVIAGMIASFLGANSSSGPEININLDASGSNGNLEFGGSQIPFPDTTLNEDFINVLIGGASIFLLTALAMAAVYVVIGSVIGIGYAKFNLDLVDRREEPAITTLLGYFKHWATAAVAALLRGLYIFLWTLLFIIPGIVAGYSYAMTNYILAEHPELSAIEAIEQSKQMMYGNRWRLFCLEFSFIGWDFLCLLTLGIGNLWLTPYKQAAIAAFYREVSGTEYVAPMSAGNPDDGSQEMI